MRSKTETLLLREVEPRLRAAIPKMVSIVGADDPEELLQNGIVIAIQLQRSARKAGKTVTGGNLAHYTLLHLRSGRRSTGLHGLPQERRAPSSRSAKRPRTGPFDGCSNQRR